MCGHRNQLPAACDASWAPQKETAVTSVPPLAGLGLKPGAVAAILTGTPDPLGPAALGVVEMAKYLVLSSFTGQPIKRFAAKPRTRLLSSAAWRNRLAAALSATTGCSARTTRWASSGSPGSHTRAAVSLAATSSGAFTPFETHELIEASDPTAIAERAQGNRVSATPWHLTSTQAAHLTTPG